MPIITRTLTHIRPQGDGTVRVQEVLTPAKGQTIRHSYKAVSEAQAITDMNARDVTEQLRNSDFSELLDWVKAKNGSDTFDYVDRDITELEGEEFLLLWFAEQVGNAAVSLSWWVEDMTPPIYSAIRIRTGFDSDQGSTVQDKAIALLAAEPFINVIVRLA